MARILIGTFPAVGHVTPFLPLARALVARGHAVRWYTSTRFQERIEATGARFTPFQHAHDVGEVDRGKMVAGGEKLEGVAALKFDLKHVFVDNAPGQLRDIQAIMREFPADVLLIDPGLVGGGLHAELNGTPLAVLNMLPMGLSSHDTAPFGLGLAPNASSLGRLRNHALNWAVEHVIFRDVQQHWNTVRASVGLPSGGWLMDGSKVASLYMHASIPGFEYPRSDLPPQVHFVGAMPVDSPQNWQPSAWWHELDGSRPVVHVTQGTVANNTPQLVAPVLEGLANENVLVVVTTGGRPIEQLNLGQLPANARVGTFLSYPELLPRTTVMVTNGGYGGVQMALSHGVPLVIAGTTEDKPEVAMRVAWSGAGINLKTAAPTPSQVRAAVRSLLDDPSYRTQAQALQAEYMQYNAVTIGVELLEQLAATGRPVLRDGAAQSTQEARLATAGVR